MKSTRSVLTPGADDQDVADLGTPQSEPTVNDLKLELAVVERELALARGQLNAVSRGAHVPGSDVLVEVPTKNGARWMAESETAHLTTAELTALIDSGQRIEPQNATLCKDGWYCRRRAAA